MSGLSSGGHIEAGGPVAAALDGAVGRFQQHGKVGVKPIGVSIRKPAESAQVRCHLLVVIENIGDVPGRISEGRSECQLDRYTTLHIRCTPAVQHAAFPSARYRSPRSGHARQRHCIQMSCEDDALGTSKRSARDDGIAVAHHFQMGASVQDRFHCIGEGRLVTGNTLDVQQGRRQVSYIGCGIK